MTITQFQYVLAVAKYKNFTTAAENSYVTQPTLSMQIQKLEEELGVTIFDRSKKPLQITEIGEQIIKQAQTIVNESERMNDIVAQQKGYIGGEFRVGIIPTVSPTLLPMFLNNFINKYPNIENLSADEILENILNVEIGLTFSRVLEDAGVFKRDEKGKNAFLKFINHIGGRF